MSEENWIEVGSTDIIEEEDLIDLIIKIKLFACIG